jgi:cytochrome bd-type quinol oxidase subunit 1
MTLPKEFFFFSPALFLYYIIYIIIYYYLIYYIIKKRPKEKIKKLYDELNLPFWDCDPKLV